MSFGIDRRARARKARGGLRGLLAGKGPDAAALGARLGRIAKRMFGASVVTSADRRITVRFLARTPTVAIDVLEDGDLHVRGVTAQTGPGYHAHVLARLAPMLAELDLEWSEPGGLALASIQDDMAEWVVDELRAGARAFGIPRARVFATGAAVNTPLGPRDAAWRDAVLADPARVADAFPWWDERPGSAARARALLALWHEVPWRAPIDDDERARLATVDADLRAALAASPEIELPWPEWVAVHGWLDDAEPLPDGIEARAGAEVPTAGYRRFPLEVEIAGGWLLELPGAFVTHVEDDTDRWWATDGDRVIEATTFTAPEGSPHAADPEALLAIAPELHTVIARIADGPRRGRAESHAVDAIHVTVGLVAQAPHVAILTAKAHEPATDWALAIWRSLRRP